MNRILRATFVALATVVLLGQFGNAQGASRSKKPLFKDMRGYANYIQSYHKAPFDRDSVRLPNGGAAQVMRGLNQRTAQALVVGAGSNVRINRDRDPWPKAEIAVGVDPMNGNVVVMSNDSVRTGTICFTMCPVTVARHGRTIPW